MSPRELLGRMSAAFGNLSVRERLLVSLAGGALALALVYLAVILPALSWSEGASARAAAGEQQLEAMTRLRREFDDVHHRLSAVEERIQGGARGNLRTTLETLAQQANVKVESMEPLASPANDRYRETKVEVGLENVNLSQTVTYLHQIESHRQALSIKSLRIRMRPDDPSLLDVNFTVSSFEPI